VSKTPQILPVLCYHNIHDGEGEKELSVCSTVLNLQLGYLKENGYNTISVQQLLQYWDNGTALPPKPVLLTFDDGYKSMAVHLYPLLQLYQAKATVFLLPGFVHSANESSNTYLSLTEIKNISNQFLEWGIHSYDHKNYKKLTPAQITEDIAKCIAWFKENNIHFVPALAFPFGAFQKNNPFKRVSFFKAVAAAGIQVSFRLGNRINFLQKNKPLMLQRIDIKGNETPEKFGKYVQQGKKKTIRQLLMYNSDFKG
jgi:peptidoglycan/xylan/chitin deacetylase (PgdA/CDA1 family)